MKRDEADKLRDELRRRLDIRQAAGRARMQRLQAVVAAWARKNSPAWCAFSQRRRRS